MKMKELTTKDISTETIWKDFYPVLVPFVRARVRGEDDAQDILQDVFVKIHMNLHTLKDQSRIHAWVFQVARNTINDYFRKKRPFVKGDLTDLPAPTGSEKHTFEDCMLPFLQKLPEKYREALVLADFRNVPQNHLARQLQISYPGLKSRVQRARRLLHSYFLECCHIESDKYGNIVSHTPRAKCLCAA